MVKAAPSLSQYFVQLFEASDGECAEWMADKAVEIVREHPEHIVSQFADYKRIGPQIHAWYCVGVAPETIEADRARYAPYAHSPHIKTILSWFDCLDRKEPEKSDDGEP
jgi:hypothetical protein